MPAPTRLLQTRRKYRTHHGAVLEQVVRLARRSREQLPGAAGVVETCGRLAHRAAAVCQVHSTALLTEVWLTDSMPVDTQT